MRVVLCCAGSKPGIAASTKVLLHRWYHLEQPAFQAAAGPMPPPPPPVRVTVQAPPVNSGPPHSAAPQWPTTAQLPVFKPGSPRSAGLYVPQTNAPGS